ncbi:uncharacterized protein LOC110423472 [Herrania umbratica]|uniref:Uncharacterized protein LOC110423472 n=1 Tax=Herrania umbratica TaxID=108875 RepID=A0A6J1B288_9ROSI|nr:uncharacterized protein LOC110423472 [Herrania umbratica]
MKNDEGIQASANKVQRIVNQLRLLGEEVTKRKVGNKFVAQQQRKAIKCEDFVENALIAKTKVLKVKDDGSMKLEGKGNKIGDNSGCFNNLTSNKDLFNDLDRSFNARVKIGNGVYLKIFGIGIMVVETFSVNKYKAKYKAKPVAKGYAQVYGIDYFKTFAPVPRHDTIRMLAALSAREG